MMDLGASALTAMLREGRGVFALVQFLRDADTDVIDDLASKEEKRIVFMRRLSAMREAESEREFGEKLSQYMRKRAFVEGLQARHQLAPEPYELEHRH